MRPFFLLSSFVLCLSPLARADDEGLLKDHKIATDGPGLLAFFKSKAGVDLSDDKLKQLIEQLGDDDFFQREQASEKLLAAGPRARARLTAALKNADLEIRNRAARCLARIQANDDASVEITRAAVRLLAGRKPAGAAAALLTHLGRAEDESVAEEIRLALPALAVREGKADAALVAALHNKEPSKRAAAALAFCKAKTKDQFPAVRKLLTDEDGDVRLSVAVALAPLGEKDAIPVLIAFMDLPPTLKTGAAEDILFRLAEQKSPRLEGTRAELLKKYRRAWEVWWEGSKAKADLAVLTELAREPGHTTVVLLDEKQVVDLDEKGKTRWTIDKLAQPLDVQRLPGERVLVAEHEANRVTEHNHKGEVVWEKKVVAPIVAQRLPNGNTFIATASTVMEVNRAGEELFSYTPQFGQQIMRARKLPGGDILLIQKLGTARFVRLDRFGKVVKEFGVQVNTSGGRIDLTSAGNVLIPEIHENRVQERTLDGKIIREIAISQPIMAFALANGHMIVTSMTRNRAVELDRAGKEVWQYKRDTRVTRAVRP